MYLLKYFAPVMVSLARQLVFTVIPAEWKSGGISSAALTPFILGSLALAGSQGSGHYPAEWGPESSRSAPGAPWEGSRSPFGCWSLASHLLRARSKGVYLLRTLHLPILTFPPRYGGRRLSELKRALSRHPHASPLHSHPEKRSSGGRPTRQLPWAPISKVR